MICIQQHVALCAEGLHCNVCSPLWLCCAITKHAACGSNVTQHERRNDEKSNRVCVTEIQTFIVQPHCYFKSGASKTDQRVSLDARSTARNKKKCDIFVIHPFVQ